MKADPRQILDLLAKRPDLTIEAVEKLLQSAQAAPKESKPLTCDQLWLRLASACVAGVWALSMFGRWLSAADWNRSGELTGWFALTCVVSIGVVGITYVIAKERTC